MASPKQGLDYWPRDVGLIRDPKLRGPRMRWGYLAVMVYESLLDILYSDKGYYIDYSKKDDVLWGVLETLQGKYQPESKTVEDVISDLVACELFSGDQFKNGKLTSHRAQEVFYTSTRTRTAVSVDARIWLLSIAEMTALSKVSPILSFCKERAEKEQTHAEMGETHAEKPQRRGKQSKAQHSTAKQSTEENGAHPPAEKMTLGEFGHVRITQAELEKMNDRMGDLTALDLVDDLDVYLENKPKANYQNHYATMLRWWKKDGCPVRRSQEDAQPLLPDAPVLVQPTDSVDALF